MREHWCGTYSFLGFLVKVAQMFTMALASRIRFCNSHSLQGKPLGVLPPNVRRLFFYDVFSKVRVRVPPHQLPRQWFEKHPLLHVLLVISTARATLS